MKNRTAEELAPLLLDLVALSLDAKQAHWNVTGPFFSPLHALFDSMTGEYRGWYDTVAERIRALGEPADGRPGSVAKAASAMPAGEIDGPKAVSLLLERVEGAAGRARGRLGVLGELDPVSQDMVIGIVDGLDKQAWMLRVQCR
jgi:starvation-inducible DNA-binding protein